MIRANARPLVMYEATDPEELAKARVQDERFRRNYEWFEAHTGEIYPRCRGRFYCISGQQLFVGDSAKEVYEQAKATFPDDDGRFTGYVPLERIPRIYAHRRPLA